MTPKFRAWDGERKQMCYSVYLGPEGWHGEWYDGSGLPDVFQDTDHPDNRLMQFTGLMDKNGVEIWEGDYIRQTLKNVTINYPDKVTDVIQEGVVAWRGRSPGFVIEVYKRSWEGKMEPQMYHSEFVNEYEQVYEVLGNVYEHPNLMEGK